MAPRRPSATAAALQPRGLIGQQQQEEDAGNQNATTATTMASRSVDSAGAPDAAVTNGYSVTPAMAV